MPQDVVSWSRHSKTCTHVFHSHCIKPWLEDKKQDECPSCRSVLVCYPCIEKKDDEDEKKGKESQDEISEESRASVKDDSFFVIVHGLISRAMPQISRPASSYNLVSLNSNSFDSADSQSALQDLPQQQTREEQEKKEAESNQERLPMSLYPLRRIASDSSDFDSDLCGQPLEMRHTVSDPSAIAMNGKVDLEDTDV
jgi:hypothetical protein